MKITSKKYYLVEQHIDKNGKAMITRTARGFGCFQLLGFMEATKHDILCQIQNESAGPQIIKKRIIDEEE